MNFLSKISLIFLCIGLFLTSCNKENTDEILVTENPNYQPPTVEVNNLVNAMQTNNGGGMDLGCITVNYPFELLLESNTSVSINSEAEFQTANNAQATDPVVDFVFPLSITDSNGNTSQMNDNATLGANFASCVPTNGWQTSMVTNETIPAFLFNNLCFDIVYPVNLEDGNGNTYTANNEAEFIDLCATVNELYFSLPLDVIDNDGNQITIEDTDTFITLLFECDGISPPAAGNGILIQGFGCNDIVFPFTILTENGETLTLNDENEYANLILSGESFELVYPFSLINIDGETIVINNIDDLIAAINECGFGTIIIYPADPCDTPAHIQLFFNAHNVFTVYDCPFDINYPIDLEVDGATNVITTLNEYFVASGAPNNINPTTQLIYPITVTQDGMIITLNNDEEVCAFIDGC